MTVSVVGCKSAAPSFRASSAVPQKRFRMLLDGRLMWIVIWPFSTVSVPLPSQASFTWNMLLSVLKSAV